MKLPDIQEKVDLFHACTTVELANTFLDSLDKPDERRHVLMLADPEKAVFLEGQPWVQFSFYNSKDSHKITQEEVNAVYDSLFNLTHAAAQKAQTEGKSVHITKLEAHYESGEELGTLMGVDTAVCNGIKEHGAEMEFDGRYTTKEGDVTGLEVMLDEVAQIAPGTPPEEGRANCLSTLLRVKQHDAIVFNNDPNGIIYYEPAPGQDPITSRQPGMVERENEHGNAMNVHGSAHGEGLASLRIQENNPNVLSVMILSNYAYVVKSEDYTSSPQPTLAEASPLPATAEETRAFLEQPGSVKITYAHMPGTDNITTKEAWAMSAEADRARRDINMIRHRVAGAGPLPQPVSASWRDALTGFGEPPPENFKITAVGNEGGTVRFLASADNYPNMQERFDDVVNWVGAEAFGNTYGKQILATALSGYFSTLLNSGLPETTVLGAVTGQGAVDAVLADAAMQRDGAAQVQQQAKPSRPERRT